MAESQSYELFRIEGVVERAKLVLKKKNNIIVYNNAIDIERSSEREVIPLSEIINIYIQEPITEDVDCRTTIIDYYEEGEEFRFTLEDDVYPKLSYHIEQVLAAEWSFIKNRKKLPTTIRWINTAQAIFLISDGRDLDVFGGMYDTPESAVEMRKTLYDSWGLRNEADSDNMTSSLLSGRANKEFNIITQLLRDGSTEILNLDGLVKQTGADRETMQRIIHAHNLKDAAFKALIQRITHESGDKGLWAWDLVRVMHLSASVYICGYYTREKALDICLEAAKKMQTLFKNWDELANDYLLGYSYWSGEDLADPDTEAYDRANIYEQLKKLENNPYHLPWDYPLVREW